MSPKFTEENQVNTAILIKFIPLVKQDNNLNGNFTFKIIKNDIVTEFFDTALTKIQLAVKPKWTEYNCIINKTIQSEKINIIIDILRTVIKSIRPEQVIESYDNQDIIIIKGNLKEGFLEKKNLNKIIHSFPFDKTILNIPLQFTNIIFLNKLSIIKPNKKNCSIKINIDLPKINQIQNKIQFGNDENINVMFEPNTEISIKVLYKRHGFQIFFLIIIIPLIILVLGILIGFIARLHKDNKFNIIFNIFELFSLLGLPFLVRQLCINEYKDLPNLLIGEGITIFDIIIIISYIISIIIAIIILLKKKKSIP